LPHSLLSVEPYAARAAFAEPRAGRGQTAQTGQAATPLVAPRYLGSRDEVWVARALQELSDLEGRRDAEIDHAWGETIEPTLRHMGARRRAAMGIKALLDRLQTSAVSAAADPRRIREVVFALSSQASRRPRAAVLEAAANVLLLTPREVEDGLFADREGARKRAGIPTGLSAASLVEKYNLALVQGLLLRAEWVGVDLRESIRAVVRYAKLRGLLADFSPGPDPETLRMGISGPLSLFRKTLKYGRALATFFPTLTATHSFSLGANCRLRERASAPEGTVRVVVDHHAPLPRIHALSPESDSAVERALIRDLRRSGSGWTIHRETRALRAGRHLVFPDFALRRGADEVLVEVVGYYTREYLTRKRASLQQASVRNLVVCVDTELDCGEGAFGEQAFVPFRKRVDVRALLAAAEGVARKSDGARVP